MCILVCRELALILQCWSILTEDVNIARNRGYWSLSTDGKESFGDCNLFRLALLQKNRLLLYQDLITRPVWKWGLENLTEILMGQIIIWAVLH